MSTAATWSKEEDKAFENAIALHWTQNDDSQEDAWLKIASLVPTKTVDELKHHYEVLKEDLDAIEAGRIPVPDYSRDEGSSSAATATTPRDRHSKRSICDSTGEGAKGGGGGSRSEQERRRGTPWTEEEHRYSTS